MIFLNYIKTKTKMIVNTKISLIISIDKVYSFGLSVPAQSVGSLHLSGFNICKKTEIKLKLS